ncbi:group-specific protein [Alkalihalobacterium elongatum]|uniref:group-specific protein n=1 Tax=Alkalihalobacterium elongatum TaxID=2675466 RepID=UPI001C1FF3D8|nr:group-specific protein [Alkalihalobacterium elongatum]
MSSCKLDHPLEDVQKKLADQKAFLPTELSEATEQFLAKPLTQAQLNELFHLLKKYDLASKEEQQERNEKLNMLIQQ